MREPRVTCDVVRIRIRDPQVEGVGGEEHRLDVAGHADRAGHELHGGGGVERAVTLADTAA